MNGLTHICIDLDIAKTNVEGKCKIAKGAKWDAQSWIPYSNGFTISTMEDAYAAMYGSGSEQKLVNVIARNRKVTRLQAAWFVLLSVKLLAIAALMSISISLRNKKGLIRVANDEHGMKSLLKAVSNDYSHASSAEETGEEEELFVSLIEGQPQIEVRVPLSLQVLAG